MSESDWTIETLRIHMQKQIDDQRRALDERYEAQTKALDAALHAADRAVTAALVSAEKAVTKAEVSSNTRFESMNEFRGQLSDQANGFMGRDEYATAHQALIEKFETDSVRMAERLRELELRLTSRLDIIQGKGAGLNTGWGIIVGAVGLVGAVISIVLRLGH